jgi:glycosyltransferase involved in cell wall biosynthesis
MSMTKIPLLAICFNNYGPHHRSRLAKAIEQGKNAGFDVVGIELASQELIYPWIVEDEGNRQKKYTLFHGQILEEVPKPALIRATWSLLNELNPQALAIAGYKNAGMLTVLAWACLKKREKVLIMDSTLGDHARHPIKEWLKSKIVALFDAALTGGTCSKEYAEFLGIPPHKISVGADVVDNDYFAERADYARENDLSLRKRYQLPEKYFLYVGRFSEEKNISFLLKAYSRYCQDSPEQAWALVLCGSGPLETKLRQEIRQQGIQQVHLTGFKQIDELPIYYGLAQCLILPSKRDTWGLVVNEAMAAGLPVLVSKACNCAIDLISPGINGYVFDPSDVTELSQLMLKLSSGQVDLQSMSRAAQHVISAWTLDTYAQNLFQVIQSVMKYQ